MRKITDSFIGQSFAIIVAASVVMSIAIGVWYSKELNDRAASRIEAQRNEIVSALQDALVDPLRLQNSKEIGRILSVYLGRSLVWGVVSDANSVPVFSAGKVPDIDKVANMDRQISLEEQIKSKRITLHLVISDGNIKAGTVNAELNASHFFLDGDSERRAVFTSLFISFFIFLLVLGTIAMRLSRRVILLKRRILSFDGGTNSLEGPRDEIALIFEAFVNKAHQLQNMQNELSEKKKQDAINQVATQVAHDIRSPLAAINSMEKDLTALPEDTRVMLRSAVNRIHDIANNLLQKNREATAKLKAGALTENTEPHSTTAEPTATLLLSSLLEPLVTEKRMQFRSKIGIDIDGRVDVTSYGLFAKIQPTEFKRVLSNLINNSVEALGEKGAITIGMTNHESTIAITIQDDGTGITPEILKNLGKKGETHGKTGGSGLGLYHAKTAVESWGGQLDIESEVGQGTTVRVILPQAPSPDWFVSELKLIPNSKIVVLDDDSSIHQIWQGRFDSLRISDKGIDVHHLSTPEQLRAWIFENPAAAEQALYLADFELLGFKETGLKLIEELNLGPQSILVTSRFEEQQIMEGCQRLKVRLIPKGLAGFVPISFGVAAELVDAILLDDDSLVHMNWEISAKQCGKKLRAFSHPDQFFKIATSLAKGSPVYVDANLGEGIKGEEVARKIYELGFKKVYLATGYEPEKFQGLDFLAGILGKEPPEAWYSVV
ncbi:HAMP domain-containing sensor histidine kinase [Bdellovibrionota bacterium FG-2]